MHVVVRTFVRLNFESTFFIAIEKQSVENGIQFLLCQIQIACYVCMQTFFCGGFFIKVSKKLNPVKVLLMHKFYNNL